MEENYLSSARKQFEYYKTLGERTFAQVNDDALFWQYNEESNSIAIIVNHLWGNMMSRWTNFLTTDGEKEWRERDQEFETVIQTREMLMERWNEGWQCLFEALDSIHSENFNTTVYIRNQGHTIIEALNRQLGHYSFHVGQIVFLGKMIVGADWESLSIPKGASKAYNVEKFSKEKHQAHFTEEFLNDNEEENP